MIIETGGGAWLHVDIGRLSINILPASSRVEGEPWAWTENTSSARFMGRMARVGRIEFGFDWRRGSR